MHKLRASVTDCERRREVIRIPIRSFYARLDNLTIRYRMHTYRYFVIAEK